MTNIHTISGSRRKAPANTHSADLIDTLTAVELYAVRALARRAGISFSHALVAARLAGIIREAA